MYTSVSLRWALGLLLVAAGVGCTDENDGLGDVPVVDLDRTELQTVCEGLVEDFPAVTVACGGGATQNNAFVTVGECEDFFGTLQASTATCSVTVAQWRECYGAIYVQSDEDLCQLTLPPECRVADACYD